LVRQLRAITAPFQYVDKIGLGQCNRVAVLMHIIDAEDLSHIGSVIEILAKFIVSISAPRKRS